MIRCLFFDAAGTLIELVEPVGQVYSRLAATRGIDADPAALQAAFMRSWQQTPPPVHPAGGSSPDDDRSWWSGLVRRSFDCVTVEPLPETEFVTLFDDLYRYFAQASAWRLFDDVLPALQALEQRFELHLISNFDCRLLSILGGLRILPHFRTWTLSSVVGVSKPHPRIFERALAAASVAAEHAVYVGDEVETDVVGATAAGMHAWHVKRPGADLLDLTEKLRAADYSCLQPPC